MSGAFDHRSFRRAYDELVVGGRFHEVPEYYPRYRTRYEALYRAFAARAPHGPIDVLDIGGGIYATLAAALRGDRCTVADLGATNADYLQRCGVASVEWNLCDDEQPFEARFDAIVFSEVIEHLPVPAHLVLARLRRALRPGGFLLCTTPNLYRLRNVVYMALGRQIFDHFRMPEGRGLGHVLEFSRDHLAWQIEKAGLRLESLDLRYFPHQPYSLAFRLLSWIGRPLFLVPRWRDCLVAIAHAPK
jgi:2-polyprenyl-3-methyl-5-hydroxy-6-metoxy-1,4-benzoquinol methylase